jgi:hypothetical protein
MSLQGFFHGFGGARRRHLETNENVFENCEPTREKETKKKTKNAREARTEQGARVVQFSAKPILDEIVSTATAAAKKTIYI